MAQAAATLTPKPVQIAPLPMGLFGASTGAAAAQLAAPAKLVIVPRATHLFEEPGTLDRVVWRSTGSRSTSRRRNHAPDDDQAVSRSDRSRPRSRRAPCAR